MKDQINIELKRLQKQHEIKILYAVESGSRAWGFASTNSDWDIRFIFVHRIEWYLSIDENRDSIEEILPNKIDLAGWDLRKTLKLFRKSNPSLFEWLRSPIVYLEQFSIIEKLRKMSSDFFNPKSSLYHYLHMAENNYREYLQNDIVRIKKYFYVIRPILACKWIEKTNTMAPMQFHYLLEELVTEKELKTQIEKLLLLKLSGNELDKGPKIQILNDFIEREILYFKNLVKQYEERINPDTDKLNQLFLSTLYEVWK